MAAQACTSPSFVWAKQQRGHRLVGGLVGGWVAGCKFCAHHQHCRGTGVKRVLRVAHRGGHIGQMRLQHSSSSRAVTAVLLLGWMVLAQHLLTSSVHRAPVRSLQHLDTVQTIPLPGPQGVGPPGLTRCCSVALRSIPLERHAIAPARPVYLAGWSECTLVELPAHIKLAALFLTPRCWPLPPGRAQLCLACTVMAR